MMLGLNKDENLKNAIATKNIALAVKLVLDCEDINQLHNAKIILNNKLEQCSEGAAARLECQEVVKAFMLELLLKIDLKKYKLEEFNRLIMSQPFLSHQLDVIEKFIEMDKNGESSVSAGVRYAILTLLASNENAPKEKIMELLNKILSTPQLKERYISEVKEFNKHKAGLNLVLIKAVQNNLNDFAKLCIQEDIEYDSSSNTKISLLFVALQFRNKEIALTILSDPGLTNHYGRDTGKFIPVSWRSRDSENTNNAQRCLDNELDIFSAFIDSNLFETHINDVNPLLEYYINKGYYHFAVKLIEKGGNLQLLEQDVQLKFQDQANEQHRLDMLDLGVDSDNLSFGPLNKNIYTTTLEMIAKRTLENPSDSHFEVKNNNFIVIIANIEFNITEILQKADFEHLHLTDELCAKFLDLYQITSYKIPTLPDNYSEALTTAEAYAIYSYSLPSSNVNREAPITYSEINKMLYKGVPDPEILDLPRIFMTTILLASGINKINPSKKINFKTYRGESHVTPQEIVTRNALLMSGKNKILKTKGFVSTSTDETVANSDSFAKKSVFEYNSQVEQVEENSLVYLYGKDISPLAHTKDEAEFLQLPGTQRITKVVDMGDGKYKYSSDLVTVLKQDRPSFKDVEKLKKIAENQEGLTLYQKTLLTDFDNERQAVKNTHEDLLDAAHHVYTEYLSKPYTNKKCTVDWELRTSDGVVNRPNHGLAHALRTMTLIELVSKASNSKLSQEQIKNLQLVSLFFVVGRENDCGFTGYEEDYMTYREKSMDAFLKYAKKINMDEKDILKYSKMVLNDKYYTEEGFENDPDFLECFIINVAHNLDLIRCYNESGLKESVTNDEKIKNNITVENLNILLDYALELIEATGDRVSSHSNSHGYDDSEFYVCSTDPMVCLKKILSVSTPNLDLTSSNRPKR
jgi:hypothetical protein